MSGENKRILFVVNDADFFISHRLPLAKAAQSDGCEVHVATPESANLTTINKMGFISHRIPMSRRSGRPWEEIGTLWALYRLYRTTLPDLVHHVTIKPIIYGSMMARIAGVPAVVNAVTGLGHIFVAKGLISAFIRAMVRSLYRIALGHKKQVVIFQNPDDQSLFLRNHLLSNARSVLIKGSGVDMEKFYPLPEPTGTPLVILASRMLWNKGVGEFVQVAQSSQNSGIKARFVLIGDSDPGNPAAVPTNQLEIWNNSGVIEWWRRRSDMPKVFAQSNIVCLPSFYREGVPKVLIEAAASGRPIVTTDMPGCREIVRHEENGLLVPVRNVEKLAAAIRRLIENPELRMRMGAKGREIAVAEFSIKKVISETLAVYKDLLE